MTASSSPQSKTKGRGEREGRLINNTREERENDVSLSIKTGNHRHKNTDIRPVMLLPPKWSSILPPFFQAQPQTQTHTYGTSCPETVV